jgi:hypothetical protein
VPPRPRFALVVLGALAGASAWLAFGVAGRPPDGGLVGLLPAWWTLGASALGGAAVAAAAYPSGQPPALLALPLVSVLPWVGGTWWPAALAWAGPAVVVPWALLAVAVAGGWLTAARGVAPRAHAMLAGGVACAWFGGLAALVAPQGVVGDEPHYLLITESLLRDGDLDLANDYDDRHYAGYFAGELPGRHVSVGYLGQQYSFHGIGPAVLVLPAYAVAGVPGVRVWLALLSAVAMALLWRALHRLTDDLGAAWAGWAVLLLPLPFAMLGTRVFPDGPAALVTIVALCALVGLERGGPVPPGTLLAAGACLSVLPWLHLRLALLAVVVAGGLAAALVRRGQTRAIGWLAAVPVPMAVVFLAVNAAMFGSLDPTSQFRQQTAPSRAGLPAGLVGLLVDHEYGLLAYAPAMVFAAAGAVPLWRRAPVLAVTCAAAVGGTWVVSASYSWWGGLSPPARMLTPVLPLVATLVAAAWTARGPVVRAAVRQLAVVGATLALLAAWADDGRRAFSRDDGRDSVFEWLSPHVDVSAALPSLFRPGASATSALGLALIWAALGSAMVLAVAAIARRRAWRDGRLQGAMAVAVMTWLSTSTLAGWTRRGAVPATPDRASLTLLQAGASGRRPMGVTIGPALALSDVDGVLWRVPIVAGVDRARGVLLHVPSVPAGQYVVAPVAPPTAPLEIELGRDAWPVHQWRPGQHDARGLALALPVRAVRVTAPAGSSDRVELLVKRLLPPDVARPLAWRAHVWRDITVYEMEPTAYVESGGFWIPADRAVHVAFSLGDAPTAPRLELEGGARDVRVTLSRHDVHREIEMRARTRVVIDTPGDVARPFAPFTIAVAGGFVAEELAPGSGDRRRLGVYVTIAPPATAAVR